jgi:hypothetical protein
MGIPFEEAGNLGAVREDSTVTKKLTTKRSSTLCCASLRFFALLPVG